MHLPNKLLSIFYWQNYFHQYPVYFRTVVSERGHGGNNIIAAIKNMQVKENEATRPAIKMADFCSEIVTELALSFFEESLNEISSCSKRSLISRAYKITSFNRSNMPANCKMESSEGSWNWEMGGILMEKSFIFVVCINVVLRCARWLW